MPRFHFNFYKHGSLARADEHGMELFEGSAVQDECFRRVQDVLRDELLRIELGEGGECRVVDETGMTVLVMPVSLPRLLTKRRAGPKAIDIHVGLQIRNRRKRLRLSQSELGRRVGVSFQQMQKYEKGINRIDASRLAAIAEELEVPIHLLFPDRNRDVPARVEAVARIAELVKRLEMIKTELETAGNSL